jgi:phytoene/squalene synthetase
MILLKAAVMRKLLRQEHPALLFATRFFTPHEQDGLLSLMTLVRVAYSAVDKAESAQSARLALENLIAMFEIGETSRELVEQPQLDKLVDTNPDYGLAWEAWSILQDEFGLQRTHALTFLKSLKRDVDDRAGKPTTHSLDESLRFAYEGGGVLGLMAAQILNMDSTAQNAFVELGTAARLNKFRHTTQAVALFESAKKSARAFSYRTRVAFYLATQILQQDIKTLTAHTIASALHRASTDWISNSH